MKWTNPERLDTYGVRLVGWPEGVPAQNPSMLKSSQNKVVHEAMLSGSMRFEKIRVPAPDGSVEEASGQHGDLNEDFSWAYDADARLPSPPPPRNACRRDRRLLRRGRLWWRPRFRLLYQSLVPMRGQ